MASNMVVLGGGGEMMPKACASFGSEISVTAPIDWCGAQMQSSIGIVHECKAMVHECNAMVHHWISMVHQCNASAAIMVTGNLYDGRLRRLLL